ncbi:helix-turn-helix domain-containing protein [Halorubraceae archaeon YAN]|nr:helix-turn-helix domain-containing protein [Halorubraceae archaeon YAN]
MRFIEEIVVDEFLPTLRSMLAEDLREYGLTQREVANALGISQSAVSKYAHGDVARHDRIVADTRVQDLVTRIADGLANGDMSRVQALVEIEVLIRQLEDGDLLAELHEEAMPELAETDADFSVHDPDSQLRTAERVRSSVRRGLRTLTNASGFAALIPNVGSNLVECHPDAYTIEDVAGIPGRIFDVKGQATVPGEPEFGLSEHVASVLLAARESGATARGAVNIKYTPELIAALSENGYQTIEFSSEACSTVTEAIETALSGTELEEAFVLYQTGAMGIEPIIYIIAPDAQAAASVARELK